MDNVSLKPATSVRNNIILIFFAITIVPFILFASYAYVKSVEGIENANAVFSMNYLQQAKSNFETYLEQLNGQINDLIADKELQELLARTPPSAEEEQFAVNMLAIVYRKKPQIDAQQVRVLPLRPSLYPTYLNTIGESADIERADWFIRSRNSEVPLWHLILLSNGRSTRPLLLYVKRFTGLHDRVPRGMVVTEVAEDHLRRFFSPSRKLDGQKFLILDADGTVLYDSFQNEWTGRRMPSEPFLTLRERRPEGAETMTIGGAKQLLTYVRMDSEPWTIVSLTPLGSLTRLVSEMNRLLIVFLGIYVLCSAGVVVHITLRYTQPVARLVRLMRKLEDGELDLTVPASSRRDEIGWLYRGFGSMLGKMRELIEQASRSERKKKELELQVLSHQINPHFLYNTLESIRWKAENHGRSDIGEMVSALGNLLRLSLNQGKDITTVGREVEQIKAYVQIEQARIGRPLRVLYFFDEGMLDLPFMRLLLQPLVENAIQHSVRDNFEKGKVIVSGYVENREIVIEIADNGKGIPAAVLAQLDEEPAESASGRQGVGLRNVNERLKLYFGNSYRLRIETAEGKGTKITIRHPILANGRAAAGGEPARNEIGSA